MVCPRVQSITQTNWSRLKLVQRSGHTARYGSRRRRDTADLRDEVTSHGGSRVDGSVVAPEQVPDVDDLQQPQGDPVDGDEHMAQRERSVVVAEQVVVSQGTVGGDVVDVVDGRDELDDPRDQSQDPIGGDVPAGTLDITGEWVGCRREQCQSAMYDDDEREKQERRGGIQHTECHGESRLVLSV